MVDGSEIADQLATAKVVRQRARAVAEAYADLATGDASKYWCDLQVALLARVLEGGYGCGER